MLGGKQKHATCKTSHSKSPHGQWNNAGAHLLEDLGKQCLPTLKEVEVFILNLLQHIKDGASRALMKNAKRGWVGESRKIHGIDMKKQKRQYQKERCKQMMCRNSTEQNKNRYESMKNKAKKVVSSNEKAKEGITEG